MEQVKFAIFHQEYYQNLKAPSCLPQPIEELCGMWTQETLKQIIQKMTKKNTAPLVLWFDKWESMEQISTKKAALQKTFDLFNTRALNRIDSLEFFSVIFFIAKGEFNQFIQNMVFLFGWKQERCIHPEEFFFFLDSFFRGISKILIKKNELQPKNINRRLSSECIKQFIENIFNQKSGDFVVSEEMPQLLMKDQELYQLLKYLHTSVQSSIEYAKEEALKNMKIMTEVKKLMLFFYTELEKNEKKQKEQQQQQQQK